MKKVRFLNLFNFFWILILTCNSCFSSSLSVNPYNKRSLECRTLSESQDVLKRVILKNETSVLSGGKVKFLALFLFKL